MASPSHRPTHSMDINNNLQTPLKERRMTSPSSLSIPKLPAPRPSNRPPSPLRNGFVPDTFTGIHPDADVDDEDEDEDDHWKTMRSPSPSSSVSQQLANFAQRVGSLVGGISPSKGQMPTDAELEAEAERERDRSRREAERILTQEALDRKLVEDRVLEMMESAKALPPPPSRAQTTPNPPSPSSSQKEGTNWWSVAKNKLTPTKEKDLTPAQQVIQETKAKEKERERERKNSKGKEKEWPASTQTKYADPAFLNLSTPQHKIPRRPVPVSPASPTPASHLPPNLTPSPMRNESPSAKEPLPMYATFDSIGTLDVHSTLLTIAKRFEKLEKWTVGHVRALEERMGDVERWLVEKENQKENTTSERDTEDREDHSAGAIAELREEINELQSRMSEMGREMARMAVSPANLSSGPSRQSAEISAAPLTTSSIVEHGNSTPPLSRSATEHDITSPLARSPTQTPNKERYIPPTARQSTSPPLMSSGKFGSTTRLPYPTGDYATPPDSTKITQRSRSPVPLESQTQPLSIPGLPEPSSAGDRLGLGMSSASSSYSNASFSSVSSISPGNTPSIPRTTSPMASRPLPSQPSPSTHSPTPRTRKRYTVALGGPIVAPDSSSSEDEDDEDGLGGETIGKKGSAALLGRTSNGGGDDDVFSSNTRTTPSARGPTRPLNVRSRSQERLTSASRESLVSNSSSTAGKFVDPLVLRRQQEVSKGVSGIGSNVLSKGKGKVPIGDLVKFFDGEKRGRS